MIRTIQIIYDRLSHAHSMKTVGEIESAQAIRFLSEKSKIDPTNEVYHQLISQISKFRDKYVPTGFIERFCLGKISEFILSKYPINIAEAFVVSYVILNAPIKLDTLYFKLGTSGLISPTIINGVRVEDIEAIAQFVIKSLIDAELIKITDNQLVILHKQFIIYF